MFQNVKQTPEQETAVYLLSTAEQIVTSTLFLPSTLNDWFNLDLNIRNSKSISVFKSKLLSFIRPVQTSIYNIFDPNGLTFLTRLWLGFNHVNEHRFRHNFQDCLNPLCFCSLEIEDTSHQLLHCHHFSQHRVVLMKSVKWIGDNFDSMSEDLLWCSDSRFDVNKNKAILKANTNYIKISERFSGSLFD